MKQTKKFIIVILILTYTLGIVPRQSGVVYAQEADSTSAPEETSTQASTDPTPAPESSSDPTPVPDQNLAQESTEPSPTPTPDPCEADCTTTAPGDVEQTNDLDATNQVETTADTGNNTVATPTPSPTLAESTDSAVLKTDAEEPENNTQNSSEETKNNSEASSSATIDTGDAIAEADVVTMANTNTANSQTDFDVQNIYGDEVGDIILVDPATAPDLSIFLLDQQNTATVTNYIMVYANSGWNLVAGGLGDIQTGAAYATVNVFNFINANLANSQLSFAIINIFGNLTGNIVLPEPDALALLLNGSASSNISQTNNAEISNSVSTTATTGSNSVGGDGQIQTGDAYATTNVVNYANSNMIGSSFYHLIINNFGYWDGQFIGWGGLAPEDPHYGQMVFDAGSLTGLTSLLAGGQLTQQNDASIENVITATANTGNNQVQEDGSIKTGNAFSTVNLLNFINTNWSNVRGFFGMINIFGRFTGNIGGADHFVKETAEPVIELSSSQEQEETKSPGGLLTGIIRSNVGTHVNPGDTVMFFIDVQNPGTGPVYDGKVTFNLITPSGNVGVIKNFDIGKLDPGKKAKISFGLVLSDQAPSGYYYGAFEATGNVGPDGAEISTYGETSIKVGGFYSFGLNDFAPQIQGVVDIQSPAQQQGGIYFAENWWSLFLLMVLSGYIYGLHVMYRKLEETNLKRQTTLGK